MANELTVSNERTMPSVQQKSSQMLNVFSSNESFSLALKMAQALASSTIVPKAYQGNVGNCMIAIEMAARINTSPMMVMQNLYIVNGNPSWSSQWIIAMINNSGRYKTELQFEFVGTPGTDSYGCRAYAEDRTGHRVEGPLVTMQMAKDEGWYGKSGSKWKTMPEVMIRYRAASFFGRVNCPDMVMGIYTQEEVYEMGDDYAGPVAPVLVTDPATGEVINIAGKEQEEEDPEITQEQRHTLFRTARQNLKDDPESVLKDILKKYGSESTAGMKLSVYKNVMNDLMNIIELVKSEEEAAESEPEQPVEE